MDEQTAFALSLQLIALCSVACALILYLLCKIRKNYGSTGENGDVTFENIGEGRGVLITSVDNLLGLHLAYHLATHGFRVFAGTKPTGLQAEALGQMDSADTTANKILKAKWKYYEASCSEENSPSGNLVVLPLDVGREDLLHDAVGTIRRYLPAGEDGLWAVINTAGLACKGRLEGQDIVQWDAVLKLNVMGTLRAARTFLPLLRNKRGRLINIGANLKANDITSNQLVAHTASRYAVEGASAALRSELRHLGVKVITLQPEGLNISRLYAAPNLGNQQSIINESSLSNKYLECEIQVLPDKSLQVLQEAILTETPHDRYSLVKTSGFFQITEKLNYCKYNIKHV